MSWYLIVYFLLCAKTCAPQFVIEEYTEKFFLIMGLFERNATIQITAFNESLSHVNTGQVRIKPMPVLPYRTDSYSVWRELCLNDQMQPVAIFGPQNPVSDGMVRDQCIKANIPHIQATWQPIDIDFELNGESEEENTDTEEEGEEDQLEEEENGEEVSEVDEEIVEEEIEPEYKSISINFYPDSEEIALAYGKLLKYYGWKSFAVLYEDSFGLQRVQKILSEVTVNSHVTLYKLNPEGDNREIFKILKRNQTSRFFLDCHADHILTYIRDAADMKRLDEYQHCILGSIDASTVADELRKESANITWLSITDHDAISNSNNGLAPRVAKWVNKDDSIPVSTFQLEALIMDDVANHLGLALDDMNLDPDETEQAVPPNIGCKDEGVWSFGAKFQDKILKTTSHGVTGLIQFDDRGRRVNYTLYVNEIHLKERQTIGKWESSNGESIIETREQSESTSKEASKEFIVISRNAEPWFYEKKCEGDDCDPNAPPEYEGFSVELVDNIFQILREEKYNYTYKFVNRNIDSYGVQNGITKKWGGLIGELLEKRADLAVCDITISEERKTVVDFSVPFMTLGISILFTKDKKEDPEWFSFLKPFDFEVWMYTATAYCLVSIILFMCARISPSDWENPEPCDKDPEELENIWTFKNCAWLTMGSIMTQGCDILPKAAGTRWVTGMWWFFAVIVCQTYIAQLSASMTSAMENEPIKNVEDLAGQKKILYGAINGGSTLAFFRNSQDKMYQHIYETMNSTPVLLVNSNEEGVKRVIKSKNKYAFFMESTSIEYKLKRDCRLTKVGGELDSKDYGIAMPANSPFRTHINRAILKMKESTKLDSIKNTWWEDKNGAKECEKEVEEGDTEGDLELENLYGLFVVLLAGLFLSLVVTAIEFMNEVRNIVVREQVPQREVIIKELKASLNFFQLQKPVIRNPSRAPSIAGSSDSERSERRANMITNFLDMEKEVQ